MARVHGKDADYGFNAVQIEDSMDSMVMEFDVAPAMITSFADVYENALAGKPDVKTTIEGSYDPGSSKSDETLFDAIGGGAVSTVAQPQGDTTGEYTCTVSALNGAFVRTLTMRWPVGDRGTFRGVIQHSGLTSRT